MRTCAAIRFAPLLVLTMSACAERPEVDQIAQEDMIGLSKRDIVGCMGEPVSRRAPAEGTEIWTYGGGTTTTLRARPGRLASISALSGRRLTVT